MQIEQHGPKPDPRPAAPPADDLSRPVRSLPWVQPDEAEQFPDAPYCHLCLDALGWDEPGPLCEPCRAGLSGVMGHDAPSWVAGPAGRGGGPRGRRAGGAIRRGEDEGVIAEDGWRDNADRARED